MHPELITLPGGLSIKTYGFFMMVGFLSAVWLAMRRAERVKADPDVVLDISLLCLLFGVGGARAFYVIHYWKTQFADAPNRFMAVIDITAGGLEFLGGFLGAVIATIAYAWWKRFSLRLYLDIMAPSAMWGLAFGRVGCFFNGCCFGAVCATSGAGGAATPALPWAVAFPYGSPAHVQHWQDRRVVIPGELIVSSRDFPRPMIVPEMQLNMSVERREGLVRKVTELESAYKDAQAAGAKDVELERIRRELDAARAAAKKDVGLLLAAQRFPSRENPKRMSSVSEIERLAAGSTSLPVHPTQLYAAFGAMLLSFVLAAAFHRRKRHGMVIGLLFVLYPVQRTLEEMIRADNPHDVAGLTISQSIGLGMFFLGAVYLLILYKSMPERSPLAVAAKRE